MMHLAERWTSEAAIFGQEHVGIPGRWNGNICVPHEAVHTTPAGTHPERRANDGITTTTEAHAMCGPGSEKTPFGASRVPRPVRSFAAMFLSPFVRHARFNSIAAPA
jgi:hypothetical protein